MNFGFDEVMGEELVARARSMKPLLQRNAARSEEAGELAPEVLSAVTDAGFFKMAVPRRWDGLSISSNALARATAELAKGCSSTAWLASVMNTAVWRQTILSDECQEDMFADRVPLFCGVGTSQAARQVEGGYLIEKGSWPYASGSRHADYFHGVVSVEGDPGPSRLAIIPMSEIKIERTWKVTGMRATGSDTVVAKDVFVPAHRAVLSVPQFEKSPTRSKHIGDPTDYWTAMPFIRTKILGTLLGTVEGILDYVVSTTERPILYTSFAQKTDSHVFDAQVGKAAATLLAVRTVMDHMTRTIDAAAIARKPMARADRAQNRGQLSFCVDMLIKTAENLMNAGGSSAFLEKNTIERHWRDFNVGSRHAMLIPDIGYEVIGRSILAAPEITLPEFS